MYYIIYLQYLFLFVNKGVHVDEVFLMNLYTK